MSPPGPSSTLSPRQSKNKWWKRIFKRRGSSSSQQPSPPLQQSSTAISPRFNEENWVAERSSTLCHRNGNKRNKNASFCEEDWYYPRTGRMVYIGKSSPMKSSQKN